MVNDFENFYKALGSYLVAGVAVLILVFAFQTLYFMAEGGDWDNIGLWVCFIYEVLIAIGIFWLSYQIYIG